MEMAVQRIPVLIEHSDASSSAEETSMHLYFCLYGEQLFHPSCCLSVSSGCRRYIDLFAMLGPASNDSEVLYLTQVTRFLPNTPMVGSGLVFAPFPCIARSEPCLYSQIPSILTFGYPVHRFPVNCFIDFERYFDFFELGCLKISNCASNFG